MDRKEAADLLDNLIGMVEDSHGADYDTALKMGIEALSAQLEVIACGQGELVQDSSRLVQDCISRQAAIDALQKEINKGIPPFDDVMGSIRCGVRLARNIIEDLPSAQPERLADDDFETIRIHLNAYKEKLCNQRRWKEAEEYQRIIDRFMSFASAQPELAQNLHNACTDLISRQAAIDAVWDRMGKGETKIGDTFIECFEMILKALPSAQPDLDEWCYDCKEYDAERHCCPRFNRVIREAVEEAKEERKMGKWIEDAETYYKAVNEKGGGVDENTPYFTEDYIVCPECLTMFSVIDNCTEDFDFCPKCGARLVQEGEDDGCE